jgi:beta-N-acetylhexosaminidase
MIRGYQEADIIPVAKHFPGGLGRQGLDPHRFLPTVSIKEDELEKDIYPYIKLIEEGRLPTLMVTHILYPNQDHQYTASLSEKFLKEIIRQKLGFKGVIVIDDLAMRAITDTYTIPEAGVGAIEAGADLLIISDDSQDQSLAYEAVLQAVKAGVIKESRVDESVKRILKLVD